MFLTQVEYVTEGREVGAAFSRPSWHQAYHHCSLLSSVVITETT